MFQNSRKMKDLLPWLEKFGTFRRKTHDGGLHDASGNFPSIAKFTLNMRFPFSMRNSDKRFPSYINMEP